MKRRFDWGIVGLIVVVLLLVAGVLLLQVVK